MESVDPQKLRRKQQFNKNLRSFTPTNPVGGFSPTCLKNMIVKLDHLPWDPWWKIKNVWVATTLDNNVRQELDSVEGFFHYQSRPKVIFTRISQRMRGFRTFVPNPKAVFPLNPLKPPEPGWQKPGNPEAFPWKYWLFNRDPYIGFL